MKFQLMTLDTLASGALEEKFQHALQKVAANINDPNTKAETKRSIVLTIEFEPNKTRTNAGVSVQATTKTAPHEKAETVAFLNFNIDTGDFTVQEHDPKQSRLEFDADKESHDKGIGDKPTN